MMYIYIALWMIVFAICYCIAFYLFYMATQRKTVREHQKEWDKLKAELEEKGADHIEIVEEYGRCMARWGGCYPSI